MRVNFLVILLCIAGYEAKQVKKTSKSVSGKSAQTQKSAIIAIQIVDPEDEKKGGKNSKRTIESSLGYGFGNSFSGEKHQSPKFQRYRYSQYNIPPYKGPPINLKYQSNNIYQNSRPQTHYLPGTTLFSTVNQNGHVESLTSNVPNPIYSQGDAPIPVIILRVLPSQLTNLNQPLYPNLPQTDHFAPVVNSIDLRSLLSKYSGGENAPHHGQTQKTLQLQQSYQPKTTLLPQQAYQVQQTHQLQRTHQPENTYQPEHIYQSGETYEPEQTYQTGQTYQAGHTYQPAQTYQPEQTYQLEQTLQARKTYQTEQSYHSEPTYEQKKTYQLVQTYQPEQTYQREQTYHPEQTYQPVQTYQPEQTYQAEQTYQSEQTYQPEQTHQPGQLSKSRNDYQSEQTYLPQKAQQSYQTLPQRPQQKIYEDYQRKNQNSYEDRRQGPSYEVVKSREYIIHQTEYQPQPNPKYQHSSQIKNSALLTYENFPSEQHTRVVFKTPEGHIRESKAIYESPKQPEDVRAPSQSINDSHEDANPDFSEHSAESYQYFYENPQEEDDEVKKILNLPTHQES